jgi:DeoD family purine-nucleoside phosphorylase
MAQLQDMDLPEGDAETLHLNPAADFHPNVLLPGDPARAMSIATSQLEAPRMFNHRRGLWGYSGLTPDGTGILVQATGMGGPSAAIVAEEVIQLGAKVLLRVGTCGAIDPAVKLGDLVVGRVAISDDGSSAALGVEGSIAADARLSDLLVEHAGDHVVHDGSIATVDLFYDPDGDARHAKLVAGGALAIEMEAATIYGVGARHSIPTACLLAVTDELWDDGARKRLTHDEIAELGVALGAVGVAAVSAFRG